MSTVEQRAAETLLDKGVPISLRAPLFLRLVGKKRINMILGNPTGGTLLQINLHYLRMALTTKELNGLDFNSLVGAQVKHHKHVYRMVAAGLLNSRALLFLFTRLMGWWLADVISYKSACRLAEILLIQGGVEDFTNIIGLGARLNMMTPQDEPNDKPYELKACGLDSMWGVIFSIAERTGWTYHDILWGTSWANIRLMLADAPSMKKVRKQPKKLTGSQLAAMMNAAPLQ